MPDVIYDRKSFMENNKSKYEKLFNLYVADANVKPLLAMLDRTDFYSAPASVKYHCHEDGGLCEHSLNVYDSFIRLLQMQDIVQETESWQLLEKARLVKELTQNERTDLDKLIQKLLNSNKVSFASVVRVTLGHDYHKINFYEKYIKNVKDANGRWSQQEAWGYRDDPFVLGEDGTNSWYIMNSVMPLNFEEIMAIENHMGSGKSGQWLPGSSGCWKKSRLAMFLHLADMYSTFIVE